MKGLFNRVWLSFSNLVEIEDEFEDEPVRVPAPDEQWCMRDKSPWPKKNNPVRIIDVREGWVRYYMNEVFHDERRELDEFLRMYGPCE